MNLDKSEKSKTFCCLFCENKYSSNNSLLNHIKINHKKEHSEKISEKINNKLKCKYCCKEYSHTQSKYAHQKILVVKIKDYIHYVPFVEDNEKYFLKSIIPSRKINNEYL